MTHPLREKVKLKPCPFCGGAASMRDGMGEFWVRCDDCGSSGAMRSRQDRAERDWNDRSTALASGSGDHAELARLAERCTSGDPWYKDGDLRGRQSFGQFLSQDRAFIAAASPATVLALLAENAALREEKDYFDAEFRRQCGATADQMTRAAEAERALSEHRIAADLLISSLKSDKAEAERKLAEADRSLELAAIRFDEIYEAAEVDDSAYRNEATIHGINGLADVAQAEIRTFISKEAERG